MDVRELVKRCADLQQRKPLVWRGTTSERFASAYAFWEPVLRAAMDVGLERPAGVRDALAEAQITGDSGVLDELLGVLSDGLSYIGLEHGTYFYGGQPWEKLCVLCSGIAFLAESCGVPDDLEEHEQTMDNYGVDLYEPVAVPPGMPRRHWWWFGPLRRWVASIHDATSNEPFTLVVDDVFELPDGTVVLAGTTSRTGPIAPCEVAMEIDGATTQQLHVEREHWNARPGGRAVAIAERVNVASLRGRSVRLTRR